MKTRLIIAWLGNLIDVVSTLHACSHGFTEVNPIMARLIQSPVMFVFIKVITMTALLLVLWQNRTDKNAVVGSWLAAILYSVISMYYFVLSLVHYMSMAVNI